MPKLSLTTLTTSTNPQLVRAPSQPLPIQARKMLLGILAISKKETLRNRNLSHLRLFYPDSQNGSALPPPLPRSRADKPEASTSSPFSSSAGTPFPVERHVTTARPSAR